jgi:hypothetical protein
MTTNETFTVTWEWLDRFRPRQGASWSQDMVALLDPAAWPAGRRSPMAGWQHQVVGRVITQAQRKAFEDKVRQSIRHDIAYHAGGLATAQQRLAALDEPPAPAPERPEIAGWLEWRAAPGVM